MTIRPGLLAAACLALLVPTSNGTTIALAQEARSEPVAFGQPRPAPGSPAITITAGRALTAEPVLVTFTDENLAGDGEYAIDWGDGSQGTASRLGDARCGGLRPGATRSEQVPHVYRYPGTWTVTARFTPVCHGQWGRPYVGRGTVTVSAGRMPSNGPSEPVFYDGGVFATPARGAGPLTVAAQARYEDIDGYLTSMRFSWGDGSPDTVFAFPLSGCHDPGDHWPETVVDSGRPYERVEHTYPHRGRYRAVVVATSTGCDGRDAQTATDDLLVTVPA